MSEETGAMMPRESRISRNFNEKLHEIPVTFQHKYKSPSVLCSSRSKTKITIVFNISIVSVRVGRQSDNYN